ncbi:MAG: class I SAM-dependent methyltransferase [Planctomycetota bacterium]
MTRAMSVVAACGVLLGVGLAGIGCSARSGRSHRHAVGVASDDATVNHRFEDAEDWARRFEDPTRDGWQRPDEVIAALALTPDSRVADIGAATGYFPIRVARAVPDGVVYGVDIEPTLVNYLNLRARHEGVHNLVALVCLPDDPRIPEPVDCVLVVNTYHHIDSRVEYFRRVHESLRPGGRLVIVDFKEGSLPVGPSADHKIAAKQVISELQAAGYRLDRRDELPYQYVLVFTVAE